MGFHFESNNKIKIEIEDNIYNAVAGAQFEKIAKKYKKIALELADKVENGELSEDEAESTMLDNTEKEIDEILGKGSSAKIFEGRERNAYDWASVLTYISDCVYPSQNKYTARKR